MFSKLVLILLIHANHGFNQNVLFNLIYKSFRLRNKEHSILKSEKLNSIVKKYIF